MPIKIQSDLPVKEILEKENIFVMDESRASHQDIRPIQILILNLMPLKEETELQLLRSLSNTPLQVDVTFMNTKTHVSLNTPASHLNKFYTTFDEIRDRKFDGLIVTGAPVEDITFEEVDYWEELVEITLQDDVLKVDGNLAVAWSGSLSFTVERSGKTLIGSAASGEGLVNVYRGTGKVLLAPVSPTGRG